jgi:hypothetical protein
VVVIRGDDGVVSRLHAISYVLHLPLDQSLLLLLDVVLLLAVVLYDESVDLLGELLTHGSLEYVKAIRQKVVGVLDAIFAGLLDRLLKGSHAAINIDLYLTGSKLRTHHGKEYDDHVPRQN